jgi:anthranilate synthase component I
MIRPDFQVFKAVAGDGDLVVISREIPFDTQTAVTAYARLARPPFGFLLESVTGGERWARWTFLGSQPRTAWRLDADGGVSRWTPGGGWSQSVPTDQPLDDLAALVRRWTPVVPAGLPRFFGGAVGYLGYDVVRHIEWLPHAPPTAFDVPRAVLMVTDVVLAIDNVFGRAHVVATVDVEGVEGDAALRERYEAAVGRIDAVASSLEREPPPLPLRLEEQADPPPFQSSSFTREAFEAAVRRVKAYIAAGDVFQVVLSQRLDVELSGARPFDLYRALRSLNPSPYMYFLELDGLSIVGSSPEVLVRVDDGRVLVRPIAGTRPRGTTEAEDERLVAELLADEKERAEHLMLVDLGRNDVGRVARFGSVEVGDLMAIERYSHVLHMVSQVEGELREGLDAFDALRATFPAGTVSGAPKVRAMEIIDELEPVGRGPYAGAVGWFGFGGRSMDAAIAIRTLVAAHGRAYVQAGAGIVADSDPSSEYHETLAKARGVLVALGQVKGADRGDP